MPKDPDIEVYRECLTKRRLVRGDHETDCSAQYRNQERVLADRARSKLLKKDWPRTFEELEMRGMGKSSGRESRGIHSQV